MSQGNRFVYVRREALEDEEHRMAEQSHKYRRAGEDDKAREYMAAAQALSRVVVSHAETSPRCFECGRLFDRLADIKVVVEDEGTDDLFWGPIHRNPCLMQREAAWNSLRAEAANIEEVQG